MSHARKSRFFISCISCKSVDVIYILSLSNLGFPSVSFSPCRLPDGSLMEITKVYPLDAVFDSPEDVPEDV